jgi:N-acetylmuramoyl-L-alanine amidase
MKTIVRALIILILYGTGICSAATIEHSYKSVYIDPFYGGKDTGPPIAKTYRAKDVTLRIAKLLQQELETRGARTSLSRNKDVFLTTEQRTVIAKANAADVYVGIRVSYQDRDSITLYHLKSQPTKAKTTGDRNELDEIFKALAFDDLAYESGRLASVISSNLKKTMSDVPVSTTTHYNDDLLFYLVTSSPCPVVVIDFNVQKSSNEYTYILNSNKINNITTSIVEAVTEFMKRSVVEIN